MLESVEMQSEIGDKNFLLKKNPSWNAAINSNKNLIVNPLESQNFNLARSKSNPHVLDGANCVKSSANKSLNKSLQQLISNQFCSNSSNNGIMSNSKLAPLAKPFSFTSMGTSNQTLSTTNAINLTMSERRRSFYSFNKFLLFFKVIE